MSLHLVLSPTAKGKNCLALVLLLLLPLPLEASLMNGPEIPPTKVKLSLRSLFDTVAAILSVFVD